LSISTIAENCRYRQLELWISTIQIVDIYNSNPRIDMNPYQIISLFMAGKTNIFGANPAPALVATKWITYSPPVPWQHSQLLISTIRIADINNSNCRYQQLSISIIPIVDIYNSNCRYQQLLRIVDINNLNCWYTIRIVDISNSNCRYRQLWINVNLACHKSGGMKKSFSLKMRVTIVVSETDDFSKFSRIIIIVKT